MADADGCASIFSGGISDGEIAPVQCKIFEDPHGTCSKKLVSVETDVLTSLDGLKASNCQHVDIAGNQFQHVPTVSRNFCAAH